MFPQSVMRIPVIPHTDRDPTSNFDVEPDRNLLFQRNNVKKYLNNLFGITKPFYCTRLLLLKITLGTTHCVGSGFPVKQGCGSGKLCGFMRKFKAKTKI
jgi:hypothetical protein